MKRVVFSFYFLCALLTFSSYGQGPISNEIKLMLGKENFRISAEQYNSNIEEGDRAHHCKRFYSGTTYAIIAYSESPGVRDIDLYLYNTDGDMVERDSDGGQYAIIRYIPTTTRLMRATLRLYDSEAGTHTCRFIIAYKTD